MKHFRGGCCSGGRVEWVVYWSQGWRFDPWLLLSVCQSLLGQENWTLSWLGIPSICQWVNVNVTIYFNVGEFGIFFDVVLYPFFHLQSNGIIKRRKLVFLWSIISSLLKLLLILFIEVHIKLIVSHREPLYENHDSIKEKSPCWSVFYSEIWRTIEYDILMVRFVFHQSFVCNTLQEALTINKSPVMNCRLLNVESCRIRLMFVLFHLFLLFFSSSVSYCLWNLFIVLFFSSAEWLWARSPLEENMYDHSGSILVKQSLR